MSDKLTAHALLHQATPIRLVSYHVPSRDPPPMAWFNMGFVFRKPDGKGSFRNSQETFNNAAAHISFLGHDTNGFYHLRCSVVGGEKAATTKAKSNPRTDRGSEPSRTMRTMAY